MAVLRSTKNRILVLTPDGAATIDRFYFFLHFYFFHPCYDVYLKSGTCAWNSIPCSYTCTAFQASVDCAHWLTKHITTLLPHMMLFTLEPAAPFSQLYSKTCFPLVFTHHLHVLISKQVHPSTLIGPFRFRKPTWLTLPFGFFQLSWFPNFQRACSRVTWCITSLRRVTLTDGNSRLVTHSGMFT